MGNLIVQLYHAEQQIAQAEDISFGVLTAIHRSQSSETSHDPFSTLERNQLTKEHVIHITCFPLNV
jgi:hypothetical protein